MMSDYKVVTFPQRVDAMAMEKILNEWKERGYHIITSTCRCSTGVIYVFMELS
jgi:hypothetical protein